MGKYINCKENFRIVYYDMGQGDCILIVCPNGQLVMIDCGSSKYIFEDEEKIVSDIREFAKDNKNMLDALILTHPDKDHYNQVVKLLGKVSFTPNHGGKRTRGNEYEEVNIKNVYYSEHDSQNASYPLFSYREGFVGVNITGNQFKTETINRIIINNEENPHIFTYKKSDEFKLCKGQKSDLKSHKYKILKGKIKPGKEWSISLIAGYVKDGELPKKKRKVSDTRASNSTASNTISLVTLLEIDGHKALFTGDATHFTEKYLLDQHSDLIKETDFVHVPHHGSETSSTKAFVDATQPKGVQVTMANAETSYYLPKKGPINRWLDSVKPPADYKFHFYDYWVKADKNVGNEKLKEWRNNEKYKDHIIPKDRNRRNYYLQIDKIDEDFTGCYYLAYKIDGCYMLYRCQTDKDLWETGATATEGGYIDWFLPGSFEDRICE